MQHYLIKPVQKPDLALLDHALRALSMELNDQHPASIEFLEQAGFGSLPSYYALLAIDTYDALGGAVVFSPVMSVTLAASGLYVSDLWVTPTARGQGLGKRLLTEAANLAHTKWQADYLKLAVYDKSTDSRQFYERLGLTERRGETIMFAGPPELKVLRGK